MSDENLKKALKPLTDGFNPPKPSAPKGSNIGKKGFNPPKSPKPPTINQTNNNK